jgi:hypothetical protein
MPENPPEKIFDLQAEFPDIDFDTIDPNLEGEDFHFRIASKFADAWNLKSIESTPLDLRGLSPTAENCLRKIDITAIEVLNAAGYPIAIDAHLDDVRRGIHKQLCCYILKKKQCNLDQTPGKRLEILLLSYSALNLTERVRICIEKNDIDGIIIYAFNAVEDYVRLKDHYDRFRRGKIRGKSITEEAEKVYIQIIKADRKLLKKYPEMTQRSRAEKIGEKLCIPTETVRGHLKKGHRVG